MGLWPTHGDESALLRFIDSTRVTRDIPLGHGHGDIWRLFLRTRVSASQGQLEDGGELAAAGAFSRSVLSLNFCLGARSTSVWKGS